MALLRNVFRPTVADAAGLRRYVASVTFLAWLFAVATDVVNHLVFFTDLRDIVREELITTATVIAIALPIARSIGKAHLELFHAKREADRLGRTDPLTGLANRRAFYEAAERLDGGAMALVIADIDRFKRVNDRYGHAAGDEIIKAVAKRMQRDLGDLGTVARLGGEEFGLICSAHLASELRARLHQFRQRVADEPVSYAQQSIFTTISVGFAARRELDFDSLYVAADNALYAAKTAGRDRVVDFDEITANAPDALPLAG